MATLRRSEHYEHQILDRLPKGYVHKHGDGQLPVREFLPDAAPS